MTTIDPVAGYFRRMLATASHEELLELAEDTQDALDAIHAEQAKRRGHHAHSREDAS